MQIDNHNYEVYTNNDLIAIHKPPSTFSHDYYFSAGYDEHQLLRAKSLTILYLSANYTSFL